MIEIMKNFSKSFRVYVGLVIVLALLSAASVVLPGSQLLSTAELPASKPVLALTNATVMLVLYGGLGFVGIKMSQKIGFADIWDSKVSDKQRFVIPAKVGLLVGIFFVVADLIFSRFYSFDGLPHPSFPASLVTSATAAIGEEIIFRLFFICFWVWLISKVLLKNRFVKQIFWIVSIVSALVFAISHVPSLMAILGLSSMDQIPSAMMGEMILLNGVVSLLAADYFRRFGFLAAVGIHFWTDIVWHVVYGSLLN